MISFFAKEAFLNVNPHEPFRLRTKPVKAGHLQRVSSMIRGTQLADRMGARFNPESGYEDDVCIYVKPYFQKKQHPKNDPVFEGRKAYMDIIDGHNLAFLAKRHPEVGVIVCSQADYKIMSKELENGLVCIPQNHCNFDREKRTKEKVDTIGIIGTRAAFDFLPEGLEEEITKRGMKLIKFSRFFSRQDVIDFYKSIDIQIVWRPYKKILSNPLKIVNAMSFGIPSVALDEKAFWELKGTYIPVGTLEALLSAIDELREDPKLYARYSAKCIEKSEDYHIDKIVEMYKKLDK